MFVYNPLLATSAGERLVAEGYSKMMPKTHDPYRMLRFGPKYLKILRRRVKIFISMNSITRITRERGVSDQALSKTGGPKETNCQPATKVQEKNKEKYAVEQIVRHVTKKTG